MPTDLPNIFAALLSACFAPAYLGLTWSTLHKWWQRLCAVAFIALAIWRYVDCLMPAFGIARRGFVSLDWRYIGLAVFVTIAARMVAAWRWNTIDWTGFRATRRKK